MEFDTYKVLEGRLVFVESRHESFYAMKLTMEELPVAEALMKAGHVHVYFLDDGTPAVILKNYVYA